MKIAIVGAGAMGSLFGGFLTRTSDEVLLYDINKGHIDAVKRDGLIVEEAASGKTETFKPAVSFEPEDVRGSDVIIIFVKSTATERVARQFEAMAKPDTIVVTLQNGLGNEEIIRKAFGGKRTAAGVTSQGATFREQGRIIHAGTGPTYLCMSDRKNERLRPFVEMLNDAGIESYIEDDIENLIWSKLIINVGINALTALTGLHNGQLLDFPEIRQVMSDLVREAVSVVGRKGISLTYTDPLEAVFNVAEKTAMNRSSMLQDFDRKKASEIDFINGAIVREAEKLGIPVPVNSTVTRLIRTMDTLNRE